MFIKDLSHPDAITNYLLNLFKYFLSLSPSDVPRVELLTGLGLSPDSVKEGSDMFFECRVEANPHVYKVTWLHEVGVGCHVCHVCMCRLCRLCRVY